MFHDTYYYLKSCLKVSAKSGNIYRNAAHELNHAKLVNARSEHENGCLLDLFSGVCIILLIIVLLILLS